MFRNEIIKIFSSKILIAIIIVLIFANGFIRYIDIQKENISTPKEYNNLTNDLMQYSDEEKIDYIEAHILSLNNGNETNPYTSEAYIDYNLCQEVENEVNNALNHTANIQEIQDKSISLLKKCQQLKKIHLNIVI